MKSVVSYRLYCSSCSEETVLRKDKRDETDWSVESLQSHKGKCPDCKEKYEMVKETVTQSKESTTDLTELDGIGATVASRLNDKSIKSPSDADKFSDEHLLSINGVGKATVESIREAVE